MLTWAQAVSGPLAGATCLWQDLDGLQVTTAPTNPPHTSILWAWNPDGTLHRARLDGHTVYLATLRGGNPQPTLPWTGDRVAAYRGATPDAGGLGTRYAQVTVHPEQPDAGHGPVTFICPSPTP